MKNKVYSLAFKEEQLKREKVDFNNEKNNQHKIRLQ